MKPLIVPFLIVFLAPVFFSCAPSRNFGHLIPLPADEIVRKMRERTISIKSMEAEGTLTIESPENSGKTNFELLMKRPDSLWMKFTGPFGISLGTLMLSRQQFIFYNARENRRLVGTPSAETLERVFSVALSFEEILDVVTGSFCVVDAGDTVRRVSISEDQYILEALTPFGKKELWVDGEAFVTTKSATFDHEGRPIITGSASRVETINGTNMPHLIRIILPKRRQSASIAYRTVSINTKTEKRFTLPSDTAEIYLDHSR